MVPTPAASKPTALDEGDGETWEDRSFAGSRYELPENRAGSLSAGSLSAGSLRAGSLSPHMPVALTSVEPTSPTSGRRSGESWDLVPDLLDFSEHQRDAGTVSAPCLSMLAA